MIGSTIASQQQLGFFLMLRGKNYDNAF